MDPLIEHTFDPERESLIQGSTEERAPSFFSSTKSLISPEGVQQTPSAPPSISEKKGGSILQTLGHKLGIKEPIITAVAGYAILGSFVGGVLAGPIGIVAGAAAGAALGALLSHMSTKQVEPMQDSPSIASTSLLQIASDEEIKQEEETERLSSSPKGGEIIKSISSWMGLSDALVEKVSNYATLGAITGAAGGAFALGIGALPGIIIGTVSGALLGAMLANKAAADVSSYPIKMPEEVEQAPSEPKTLLEKGGECLKSLRHQMGLSDACIENMAWGSVLGIDIAPIFGPVGVIVCPVIGALIGISVTKEEIKSPDHLNQEEAPIASLKAEGGWCMKSISLSIKASESFISHVAGYAVVGAMVGTLGGPIGVAVGTLGGAIIGSLFGIMGSEDEVEERTSLLRPPSEIEQAPVEDLQSTKKGGSVLEKLKKMGSSLGMGEATITVATYAILGCAIGGVAGPIGLVAGTIAGGVIGGALSHMKVREEPPPN